MASIKVWERNDGKLQYVGSFGDDTVWASDMDQGQVERTARRLAGSTGELVVTCQDSAWEYPENFTMRDAARAYHAALDELSIAVRSHNAAIDAATAANEAEDDRRAELNLARKASDAALAAYQAARD